MILCRSLADRLKNFGSSKQDDESEHDDEASEDTEDKESKKVCLFNISHFERKKRKRKKKMM